jgi:hypothetical protein
MTSKRSLLEKEGETRWMEFTSPYIYCAPHSSVYKSLTNNVFHFASLRHPRSHQRRLILIGIHALNVWVGHKVREDPAGGDIPLLFSKLGQIIFDESQNRSPSRPTACILTLRRFYPNSRSSRRVEHSGVYLGLLSTH